MATAERGAGMSDTEALLPKVQTGTQRQKLEAIRDRLAAGIDGASDRQLIHLAPLAKQLVEVLERIADLPDESAPADSVESAQGEVERLLRAVG